MIRDLPSLAFQGVSRIFPGGVHALKDVSFSIPAGGLTAVIGPSGCGKTTLLRIAAGLDRATSGSVNFIGPDGKTSARGRENLSVCFQDARLLPWRNVVANVALPLELSGVSRVERLARANQVITAAGLAPAQTRLPSQLSGGMRMRVALARTLVTSPDVLLLALLMSSRGCSWTKKFAESGKSLERRRC